MPWSRASTVEQLPADPLGEAVAAAIVEILGGASVELRHSPQGAPLPPAPTGLAAASATAPGPPGWQRTLTVRLGGPMRPAAEPPSAPLLEILTALPHAGLRAAAGFSGAGGTEPASLGPSMRRALRDTVVVEALSRHHAVAVEHSGTADLIAATIEFLIELSGTRVESHDLTHGVVITDVLHDTPRLRFQYPADLGAAKRAPLLFDGQRSLLVVDRQGRARTELQRHRLHHLIPGAEPLDANAAELAHAGSLVAETTRRLGALGFFLRADRTIWAFADGQPLLLRRGEHWTAFPLELDTTITNVIGGGASANIVVQTAFIISAQRHGAILAIVGDADALDGVVSAKDRYDLRNALDPLAMRTETRLHHLIDAEELDARTLARLAALDGATILDRDGNLLAYGAIVASADSQHEGARTAAAKTLSQTAEIVLKVSADGDITVFRGGAVMATLLRWATT